LNHLTVPSITSDIIFSWCCW